MLTRHAEKRLRRRLRVEGDLSEHINLVLNEGVHRNNVTGATRRYLDDLYYDTNLNREFVVYNKTLYIFEASGVLVTAWKLKSEGELRNEQDLRDQRLTRKVRFTSRSDEEDRRTSTALRDAYDYYHW